MHSAKPALPTHTVNRHLGLRDVLRILLAMAAVWIVVGLCLLVPHVNITASALILVTVVVGIALGWGRMEAMAAAVAASLALDYYFLPPRGFGIESVDHWVVLVAFLVTAFGTALVKARASEKTVEAELARRADDLKSAVFSALAHDARGPLGSIKIAATTLLSDSPGTAAQQRELASIIVEEVDRMNRWIEEACQVSQTEAAELPLHRAPCDVQELVDGAVREFGPRLAGRRVGIAIPESLPMAECDGEMIQRVLKLLVDNALHYSPAGTPIEISSLAEEDRLVITVADAGPGIPEEERTRIFEKGYRGVAHRPGVPGTGLGLASARQMLESQGGRIWMTNRPEGGAAFHVSLPTVAHADV